MTNLTSSKDTISIKLGIKALLSIRDFENAKINYELQLNKIRTDIENMSKIALATIKHQSSPETTKHGETLLHEFSQSADSVHKMLLAIKIKIELKNRTNSSELWTQFNLHLKKLKIAYSNLDGFAYTFLQDSEMAIWQKNMHNFAILVLPSIFSFCESSKLALKIIESYTHDELNKITKTMLKPIPSSFNTEADYLVPLKAFETEFASEKKLWATFLAIVAEEA
jgi:hypothetical protein